MNNKKKYRYKDFTENKYREYVVRAKSKFNFIYFCETEKAGKTCLWRHDIDTTPHRALRMAMIENEEGVKANYFVHLHSDRYNFLEKEITHIIKQIDQLGHDIGLHFDPAYYGERIQNLKDMEGLISFEKHILEDALKRQINSLSFHNPTLLDIDYSLDQVGGLINTYGKNIQRKFTYISDSQCIWRFKTLEEVLSNDNIEKLHVLLHPECWSKKPLSPYARFRSAINERRDRTLKSYIDFAKGIDRKVIR